MVLPDEADEVAVLDRAPEIPCPDASIEPSAAMDGATLDGNPSTSITVKLLCGVRDSPNGFGPLKYLAKGLCLILENCKV